MSPRTPWSAANDARLQRYLVEGCTPEDIATRLHRPLRAVQSRIGVLRKQRAMLGLLDADVRARTPLEAAWYSP